MIITCEQCQTRFKVGDDKLASGPIRVRCSKCNHVFMASGLMASAGSMPPSPTFPPAAPAASAAPATTISPMPPTAFAGAQPTAVHGPFHPHAGAGGAPGTGPPRAGIFRPPTTTMPISNVPPPSSPPAFSSSPTSPPGFSSSPPAFSSSPPRGSSVPRPPTLSSSPGVGAASTSGDPFAGAPTAAATPRALDPFGLAQSATPPPAFAPLGRPPSKDPFAGLGAPSLPRSGTPSMPPLGGVHAKQTTPAPMGRAPTKDPFAGLGTPSPRPPTKDPFSGVGAGVPDPFKPVDPFGVASGAKPEPFGADPFTAATPFTPAPTPSSTTLPPSLGAAKSSGGGMSAPDPFASAFGGAPPAKGMIGAPDPFGSPPPAPSGELDVDDADVSVEEPSKPQSSAPFEVPGGDPFGGLDAQDEAPVDAGNLFASPATAAPAPQQAQASPPRVPEQSRVAPPSSMSPGADMTKLRRLETVQRVKELAWAAGQGLLFLSFLVVAIVLGRGGSLERLVQGDVRAAFIGESGSGELGVEETRVSRRVLASGSAIVVVTGVVHNQSDQSVPAARVDVRFGDVDANAAPAASGWAWSSVDGVDVDALPDASGAPALSLQMPKSSSLAPGDRAPFVVLAPAPPDGARVRITATNVGGATASGAPASPTPAAPAAMTPPPAPAEKRAAATAATAAAAKPTKPLVKPVVVKPVVKPKPKPPGPGAPATP